MVKIVVAVMIAVVLFNAAWFVLRITVLLLAERKRSKRYKNPYGYESEYREAFMLECSKSDIKGNSYAERLDKCIKKIDREEKHLEKARRKSKETLSKMKMPEC